jgi:hypothetical protein
MSRPETRPVKPGVPRRGAYWLIGAHSETMQGPYPTKAAATSAARAWVKRAGGLISVAVVQEETWLVRISEHGFKGEGES